MFNILGVNPEGGLNKCIDGGRILEVLCNFPKRLLKIFNFSHSDVQILLEEKKTKQKEDKRREIAAETLKKRPILKYCRDKEGAMSCIEDDPLLFMKEIDWFKNCLDEEVVKSLLQKIERIIETEFVDYDGWGSGIVSATVRDNYHYEMLHSLRDFMYDRKGAVKFSCGYDFIKYLCNRVDRPIRGTSLCIENIDSLGKSEKYNFSAPGIVSFKYLSSMEKGEQAYMSDYIWFIVGLTYKLLEKKKKYDLNDADLINCVIGRIVGSRTGHADSVRDWLISNISKFPDQSLDYCVFSYIGKYLFKNDNFLFKKFKVYPAHIGRYGDYMVYHCPYEADDDFFETLYRDIYVNRGNNLEKMKNMSFSELLTIYLSTGEKGKEGMKDSEIEDLLISKDVQSGDVSKVLMNQLLEKLDKDGNKKLLERIKKKFRKIQLS